MTTTDATTDAPGGDRPTDVPPPPQRGRQPHRLRPHAPQGGRPLPAGPGQLPRRHPAARACCTAPSCAARYAHARIVSIDTSAAEAHPKVKAVITGAMLETLGLAWMPTLSHDVQAVLATDKVRFQGQEVAFVVAEDRYAARDALELIDVDYEPLEPGHRRPPGARRRRARSSATTSTARPTTTSSTGSPATRPRVRRGVRPAPTSSSPRTCSTPARTRRRWRRAARSPTWTR